jgi:hypothetical protein
LEKISAKDLAILRSLAQRQLEMAHSPKNHTLEKEWTEHNAFRGKRPMIHLEMWTFENDVIPPLLECEGIDARDIEMKLWRGIANQALLGDDTPVLAYYSIPQRVQFELFGFKTEVVFAYEGSVGRKFIHKIDSLEDPSQLGETKIFIDCEGAQAELSQAQEIFGDILPPKLELGCLYAVPTQLVVFFMGMENMYISMLDYPDEFKAMMGRIADDYNAYFRLMETEKMISPTCDGQRLNQGSFCFTKELPDSGILTTKDVWAYMDSQETVGISPDSFGEFIFPCYKALSENFTHLSYGCCEPVHAIWDKYLSAIPSIKKVSISPWCNEEFMGDRLRGKDIIFHRKPSPNFLGVGDRLDEDAIRSHFKKTLAAASGCKLEISQRDVYSISKNVDKARRYIEIIRETIDEHWKG